MTTSNPGMRPVPEAQREHTARWFAEWKLDEAFSAVSERDLDLDRSPGGSPGSAAAGVPWRSPADPIHDPFPAPGQIRLLPASLTADDSLPLYVAVLSDWEGGLLLVAPFSPFSSPASRGELQSGRAEPLLSVLCPWCAVSVSPFLLARSRYQDMMDKELMMAAWEVFRHAATGSPVPKALEDRVGAPIVHPLDPRIRYQRQLSNRMALVARRTAVLFEDLPGDSATLSDFRRFAESLPVAAASADSRPLAWGIFSKVEGEAKLSPAGESLMISPFCQLSGNTKTAEGRFSLTLTAKEVAPELHPLPGDLARLVRHETEGTNVILATGGVISFTGNEWTARLRGDWATLRNIGTESSLRIIVYKGP